MEVSKSSEIISVTDTAQGLTYYLPAIVSISPSSSKTLTEYPTTEGTPLTDHAYNDPDTINMTVRICNVLLKNGNNYYIDDSGNSHIVNIEETKIILNNWYENSSRLTIQTRHALFTNMVMKSKSWTEDSRSLGMLSVSLSFQEIRIAQIHTVVLGPFSSNAAEAADTIEKPDSSGQGSASTIIGSVAGGALVGALVVPGGVVAKTIGAVVGGAIGFFKAIL